MLAQAINRRFAFFCNTSEYGNYWGIRIFFRYKRGFVSKVKSKIINIKREKAYEEMAN